MATKTLLYSLLQREILIEGITIVLHQVGEPHLLNPWVEANAIEARMEGYADRLIRLDFCTFCHDLHEDEKCIICDPAECSVHIPFYTVLSSIHYGIVLFHKFTYIQTCKMDWGGEIVV